MRNTEQASTGSLHDVECRRHDGEWACAVALASGPEGPVRGVGSARTQRLKNTEMYGRFVHPFQKQTGRFRPIPGHRMPSRFNDAAKAPIEPSVS